MEARAIAKYVSISPRKVQRALAGLRGLPVAEAQARLRVSPDRASRVVAKVLTSAVANAEHRWELDAEALVVRRVSVDRGPVAKRLMPRARGRADILTRRSSHITVVVGERAGA